MNFQRGAVGIAVDCITQLEQFVYQYVVLLVCYMKMATFIGAKEYV